MTVETLTYTYLYHVIFLKFCGDHDLENLGKLEPPPAAPQRRESAVVGEQLPMIGFVQGICMRLAGTSGTSSTAWDNFRPTKKKQLLSVEHDFSFTKYHYHVWLEHYF